MSTLASWWFNTTIEVIEGVPTIVWTDARMDITTVPVGSTRSMRFKTQVDSSSANPMLVDSAKPIFHATKGIKVTSFTMDPIPGLTAYEIGYGPTLDSDVGMVVLYKSSANGDETIPRLMYIPPGNYLQFKTISGGARSLGTASFSQEVDADSNLNDAIDGTVP